jgi:hypothetical protein
MYKLTKYVDEEIQNAEKLQSTDKLHRERLEYRQLLQDYPKKSKMTATEAGHLLDSCLASGYLDDYYKKYIYVHDVKGRQLLDQTWIYPGGLVEEWLKQFHYSATIFISVVLSTAFLGAVLGLWHIGKYLIHLW